MEPDVISCDVMLISGDEDFSLITFVCICNKISVSVDLGEIVFV